MPTDEQKKLAEELSTKTNAKVKEGAKKAAATLGDLRKKLQALANATGKADQEIEESEGESEDE